MWAASTLKVDCMLAGYAGGAIWLALEVVDFSDFPQSVFGEQGK